MTVTKAKVVNLSTNASVDCHFNPAEFTLGNQVEWKPQRTLGGNAPVLTFAGGRGGKVGPLTFLFDTTDTGADVRSSYTVLTDLTKIDATTINAKTGKGKPGSCRFEWGSFLSFTAVITSLTQTFTMFKVDGTPLRARVSVEFQQVDEPVGTQNPTSRSQARKTRIVHEGETLCWIAYKEYGDAAEWRHIAATNDLEDPKDLTPGQILKLVPLP